MIVTSVLIPDETCWLQEMSTTCPMVCYWNLTLRNSSSLRKPASYMDTADFNAEGVKPKSSKITMVELSTWVILGLS